MYRLFFLAFAILLFLFYTSCRKAESISVIPKIEYVGVSKKQMRQGALNNDTLWLQFKFEDGDGDLGYTTLDTTTDIFVKDSRTNNLVDRFKIPELPPSDNEAQKGNITIRIFTTCCIFPKTPSNPQPCDAPPEFPFDSLQYFIYIVDRAGHSSNVIQSEFIKLLCQ